MTVTDVYLVVAMDEDGCGDRIDRVVCHARDEARAMEVMNFLYAEWNRLYQELAGARAARDTAALATRDPSRPQPYDGAGHPPRPNDHPSWAALRGAVMAHAEKFKALKASVQDPDAFDLNMMFRPVYRVLRVRPAPALPAQTAAMLTLMNSDQGDPEPT